MKSETEFFNTKYPSTGLTWNMDAKKNGAYILLHGFNQDAAWVYEELKDVLPKDRAIVSLQAPLPIPMRIKGEWRLGFSWYVFNFNKKEFLFPMDMAISLSTQWIDHFGLMDVPKTFIGFSQGGYMSPFIARECPNVEKVIGINSRFRNEELSDSNFDFELIAINGTADEMVDPKTSEESYNQVIVDPAKRQFHKVEGSGHFFDDALIGKLKEWL